jgi:hypothetical protein
MEKRTRMTREIDEIALKKGHTLLASVRFIQFVPHKAVKKRVSVILNPVISLNSSLSRRLPTVITIKFLVFSSIKQFIS